jgi:hypothetical protein
MAFYLYRDGESKLFELETLRGMARKGELREDEYVYDDRKGEWIGAAQIPEMANAWSISEDEATVAMEIPPDFFAEAEAAAAARKAAAAPVPPPAPSGPAPMAPAPVSPAPVRQQVATPAQPVMRPVSGGTQRPVEPRPAGGGGGGGRQPRRDLHPGEIVSPMRVVILTLVTCGIYGIIWVYKRINEINAMLGREEIKPLFFFLGFICSPLWLLIFWKMIKALPEMAGTAGVQLPDRLVVLLVCLLFFYPAFLYLYQSDLNTIWQAAGVQPAA